MSTRRRIAAIDIGTVTTRLLVADVDGDGVEIVERSTDITHLGEGLTVTGTLSSEAMARVGEVIARYARRCEALGVDHVEAIATSASRDAGNAGEFRALLQSHGVHPLIIDGAREAQLSFLGATYHRAGDGLLVVDCGGGSTELILGDALPDAPEGERLHVVAARSIDVGSRRLSERFLASDPPTRAELAEARAWIVAEMRPFFDRLDERPTEMLALAGTATSLAAIRLDMAEYDPGVIHGSVLDGSDVADLLDSLVHMSLEKRRRVVGLHPDRAGVIVAGTLILETVMALAGLDRMVVSEYDILYGILLDAYRAASHESAEAKE